MKKKLILGICIVLLLIMGKQLLDCICIAHYNRGNAFYEGHNYDEAIEEYNRALMWYLPKDKECSVRINLALAMVFSLGEGYDDPEKVDESLAQLRAAREVLLKDGCATEDGEGHNKTAEKLKREIEELIEELEEQSEEKTDDGDSSSDDREEEKEDEPAEEDLKERLQEMQSDANMERQESLQSDEEFEMDFNFDLENPIW